MPRFRTLVCLLGVLGPCAALVTAEPIELASPDVTTEGARIGPMFPLLRLHREHAAWISPFAFDMAPSDRVSLGIDARLVLPGVFGPTQGPLFSMPAGGEAGLVLAGTSIDALAKSDLADSLVEPTPRPRVGPYLGGGSNGPMGMVIAPLPPAVWAGAGTLLLAGTITGYGTARRRR